MGERVGCRSEFAVQVAVRFNIIEKSCCVLYHTVGECERVGPGGRQHFSPGESETSPLLPDYGLATKQEKTNTDAFQQTD